jgi:hypothetical protein
VVTVQFVRYIAYTTFVVRRHISAGQSRKHRAAGIREQADPGLSGPGQIIPEGDTMSTVTMQDLELETAELLPARETLCGCGQQGSHGGSAAYSYDNNFQIGLVNFNNSFNNGLGGIL